MRNSEEKEQIQNAIEKMLEEVKTKAPHHEKSGWKLQKFHDHLHLVDYMEKFGSPMNTVNGSTEHSLIGFGKIQQKEHKKTIGFVEQVCETVLVEKAKKALELSKNGMHVNNVS